MPSRLLNIRHLFDGGLATDFGRVVEAGVGQGQVMKIPFLLEAEDAEYKLSGAPIKIGGASKLNSTQLESGAAVRGLYDFWRQGTAGAPVQQRIIHVGAKVKRDLANGVFVDILSGLSATSLPHYHTFTDLCIILSDGDVAYSYDGTTATAIAGAPPGSFGCEHQGRDWMAGDDSAPSTLYYSVAFNPLDWAGAGSGAIQISPNDGDRILALFPHNNELFVFKGPNKQSIHRITGSAPTGADAFARRLVANGIGCVGPNAVFGYGSDVGFVAHDGSVHSLKTTAAFGDYLAGSLSLPINGYLHDHINPNRSYRIWAETLDRRGGARIAIPIDSSSSNNQCLWMDYRFDPPRWARQPSYGPLCQCLARVIDSGASGLEILMGGGSDGYVRKLDQVASSIDGSDGLSWAAGTPWFNYGDPIRRKTIYAMSAPFESRGRYDVTVRWQRDQEGEQEVGVGMAGAGDVLGPVTTGFSPFILNQSRLAAFGELEVFQALEDGGEFSAIRYAFAQSGLNEPVAMGAGFTAQIEIGAESLEALF